MRISIAERMFERVIENCADSDLDNMHQEIVQLKERYSMTYRGFVKIPFIKNLFDLIEDEWGYRHQMDRENNI
jgi:hypothetical protein